MRALSNGAIDIGLASRKLRESDVRLGLRQTPLAKIPLAVVTNTSTEPEMTMQRLVQIYNGEIVTWPDGSPVTLLVRQSGDSTTRVLAQADPRLGQALKQATDSKHALVCYTDQKMRDALVSIKGAIGFLDVGSLSLEQLPLKIVSIRHEKTSANDESSTTKHLANIELSLVTLGDPTDSIRRFLAFVRTHEVFEVLQQAGYSFPASQQPDGAE